MLSLGHREADRWQNQPSAEVKTGHHRRQGKCAPPRLGIAAGRVRRVRSGSRQEFGQPGRERGRDPRFMKISPSFWVTRTFGRPRSDRARSASSHAHHGLENSSIRTIAEPPRRFAEPIEPLVEIFKKGASSARRRSPQIGPPCSRSGDTASPSRLRRARRSPASSCPQNRVSKKTCSATSAISRRRRLPRGTGANIGSARRKPFRICAVDADHTAS